MIEATSCGGVVIYRGKILALYKSHSRPQREEFFVDSGYYKFHEIYHLLRFSNEKQIVEKAYQEYLEMRSQGLWGKQHRV